ncbi:hypothetical protein GGR62_001785 [Xanthomonas campestris]|nr:hypothetical protein [Xanthomonas sp. 3075]
MARHLQLDLQRSVTMQWVRSARYRSHDLPASTTAVGNSRQQAKRLLDKQ